MGSAPSHRRSKGCGVKPPRPHSPPAVLCASDLTGRIFHLSAKPRIRFAAAGVPCVMAERKRQVESQKLEVCAPKGLQELEQTGQPVPTMETHWITERNCKT